MIRVVLDTNVVISALVFAGPANQLVPAWQQGQFAPLVSKALLAEYIRVLHYSKFRLTAETIRHLIEQELLPFVTAVKVRTTPRVIREDPSDDHVLACAVAGRADLIVSGDAHLLSLRQYRRISIVTIADVLRRTQ